MKALPAGAPAPRPDRPATQVLHDEPNARIIAFHLLPGQEVPPHRNPSTVVVQVVEGEGLFRGEGEEAHLRAGETVVFAPGETHSMRPVGGPLRFLAVLAPGPR